MLPQTSMPVLRASLRQPSAATRVLSLPLRSSRQTRAIATGQRKKDDLGGPGGQEPPPQSPSGGSDVAQRNWPLIGGVLAAGAGLVYFLGSGSKKSTVEKQLEPVAREGERGLKKLEAEARDAAATVGGKKPGVMAGWRTE